MFYNTACAVANNLFPYGPEHGDWSLYNSDDGIAGQWYSSGIQIYCHRYNIFYVSVDTLSCWKI